MIKLLLTLLSENSRSVRFQIGHEKVSFDWPFSQLAWNSKSFSILLNTHFHTVTYFFINFQNIKSHTVIKPSSEKWNKSFNLRLLFYNLFTLKNHHLFLTLLWD